MKVSIKVPDNLSEITLEQYQKYVKIYEQNKDIENAETFLELKMIDTFCYIPYADAVNIKYKDVKKIVTHIGSLLSQKPDLVRGFNLLDKKFGFVTNLDELSYDEYTTIDTNIVSVDTWHIAMGVLYRPIQTGNYKTKYITEDYQIGRYWEVMKHMPLEAALSSVVFFYRLGKELSKATLSYLNNLEMSTSFQQDLNLVKNGIGITHFTDSVEEILQSLDQLEN